MNYKMIRFVISWVLKVEGMLMLFPALVGAMYQEKTGFAYLIWGLLCIAAGLILCFRKPSNMEIYSRDGFVCVSLSWVDRSQYCRCCAFCTQRSYPRSDRCFF